MTIERKNKDAVKLDQKDSPKVLFSSNYAIRGEGNSHNRRRYELEVAQYFSEEKTPEDVFGRQLFDDWSLTDWNLFDNYMVHCVQLFLANGLVKQKTKNLKTRKFVAETSFEFFEFSKVNIAVNNRIEKQVSYNFFLAEYPDFKDLRWFNRKRYNIWCEKYANFIGAKFADVDENGLKCFEIINNEIPTTNDEVGF